MLLALFSMWEPVRAVLPSLWPSSFHVRRSRRGTFRKGHWPWRSRTIREALTAPLNHIVSAVKIALEEVPPEIGADISERGIMLTGGGAMIPGLDRLLAEETGLHTLISDEPLTCVVRGCGLALERMDELGGIFTHE